MLAAGRKHREKGGGRGRGGEIMETGGRENQVWTGNEKVNGKGSERKRNTKGENSKNRQQQQRERKNVRKGKQISERSGQEDWLFIKGTKYSKSCISFASFST